MSLLKHLSRLPDHFFGTGYDGSFSERMGRLLGIHAPPVANPEDFSRFMLEQATFTVQKFAYGYCRTRVGKSQIKLMLEEEFQTLMNVCRWDGMASIMGDQMVLCWNRLTHHIDPAQRPALADALCLVYDQTLDAQPPQPHRALTGWADMQTRFHHRMKSVLAMPEDDFIGIIHPSWDLVYDLLPLHKEIRDWDRDKIYNAYRLWMIRNVEEIDKRLVPDRLAPALLALAQGEGRR